MHKHKKFRHGPPLFHPGKGGWIWLIVLGFIFSKGNHDWWPGIFIVIGFFMIFGSLFREERRPDPQPYSQPMPAPMDAAPRAAPRPAPQPAAVNHPVGSLPSHCPNCGGPTYEVKWTSAQSAACTYCGSNLPLKNQ